MSKVMCHYEAAHGWLGAEHLRDCKAADCSGCRPCGKDHCGMRGRCAHHVDRGAGIHTCPRCVGKVRADLARIVTLHTIDVPSEALHAGVDSEAFNLAGPSASVDQLDARRRVGDRDRGFCEWPIPRDDDRHAYHVLGRWDLALREWWGPQTDLLVTVERAAAYLTGLLDGGFPHGDEFEEFARDVAACRDHYERVVHEARVPETGARCPECGEGGPRLVKHYARGDDERTKRGDHDTWHCPRETAHWWSERDYRDRVASTYVQHADRLPTREMAERLDIPASTIRRWASTTRKEVAGEWVDLPPRLRSVGLSVDGRKTYRVSDVATLAGVSLDSGAKVVSK